MSGNLWDDLARTTGAKVIVPRNDGRFPHSYPQYTILPPLRTSLDADSDEEKEDEEYLASNSVKFPGKHEYRRLKPDEIRLLVLNPGLPEEPIKCFLEHHSVNRAKRYRALSYVWGNPKDSFLIQVDGRPFKVTENLKAFLAAYRTNTTCPVLWIDAICIDQNNIPERNAQVQLMKRVYEGAECVEIWLGPELDNTKAAIREIEDIYHEFWLPRLRCQRAAQRAILSITATDVPVILGNERAWHEEAWAGIEDLLQRPWWSRIWVYQEVTAPTKHHHVVRCGRQSVNFHELLTVNQIIQHVASIDTINVQFDKHGSRSGVFMKVYSELRREYRETGISSFLRLADLLPTLRGSVATNPRDKLYALIPTSVDGAELLDVDYGLPVHEVYTRSALSFIEKHRNLDILGHCTKPEKDSHLTLPSWVPDWTSKSVPERFFKRKPMERDGKEEGEDKGFKGSLALAGTSRDRSRSRGRGLEIGKLYNASLDIPIDFRVDEALKKLFCRGFEFDVVEYVSSSSETLEYRKVAQEWQKWLQDISLTQEGISYDINTINGESIEDALSRTLEAGCSRVGVDLAVRGCTAGGVSSGEQQQVQMMMMSGFMEKDEVEVKDTGKGEEKVTRDEEDDEEVVLLLNDAEDVGREEVGEEEVEEVEEVVLLRSRAEETGREEEGEEELMLLRRRKPDGQREERDSDSDIIIIDSGSNSEWPDDDPSSSSPYFSSGWGTGTITSPHPFTFQRRLILTYKRYMGLAAQHVQAGDIVAVLFGAQVPLVLRKVGEHYFLVGEAHVHGIMDGEAIAGYEESDSREFEIW